MFITIRCDIAMLNDGQIGGGVARRSIWRKRVVKEAKHIWQDYPIQDYGKGWDDPGM